MNRIKTAMLAIISALVSANCIANEVANEVSYSVSERTDVIIDEKLKVVCVRLFPNARSSAAISGCWTFSQAMKDATLDNIVTQAKKQLNKGETK